MIEFLCPNGHRIHCAADQAGRAAKCARCGVRFRVPDAGELNSPQPAGPDSGISRPEFTDSGIGSRRPPAAVGRPPKDIQFEFLCPNGHRLFGPATLQGKTGECPECGSRFVIPTCDAASSEPFEPKRLETRNGSASEAPAFEVGPLRPSAAGQIVPRQAVVVASSPADVAAQAMASLFTRLWDAKPADAAVELLLRDGEIVRPERFFKRLSRENRHAVVAVKEADDSLSIIAVAWDNVRRVSLRGLHELPNALGD
ncbi:MAG: hypothetical protein ABFC63_00610 [Thermoguttaceae bacterium]